MGKTGDKDDNIPGDIIGLAIPTGLICWGVFPLLQMEHYVRRGATSWANMPAPSSAAAATPASDAKKPRSKEWGFVTCWT
jgi:hypothetical protein